MSPIEPFQMLIGYLFILFIPGFFWTFLFKGVSARLGIIKRLLISSLISITTLPLLIFLLSKLLDLRIDLISALTLFLLITFLPFAISTFTHFLQRLPVQKPKDLISDMRAFFPYSYGEVKKIKTSTHHIILLSILIVGAVLTLLPHIGYGLPIHTDEWHYMAFADNLISREVTHLEMPYYGWDAGQHWEIGFIVFIASVKVLSGISWPMLFTTLPTFIFCLTILTAYLIGKKHGYGLHSAFIVALAPSTLRFLGPVFLVPIALGLFLILCTIYLVINHKNLLKYPLAILALAFTFLMHPPSGGYLFIALCALLVVYIFTRRMKDTVIMGSVLGCFVLCIFITPWSNMQNFSLDQLTSSGAAFLPFIGADEFFELVSYIPIMLAIIGAGFLIKEKGQRSLAVLLVMLSLILFIIVLQFVLPNFFQVQAVYDRAIILLTILLGLVAGAGLLVVQNNVGKPLFVLLISCLLALSLFSHMNEPYYNIISEDEYQDFTWIRDNLNSSFERAILDPWKAVAFTPVTGKEVFFRIPQGPSSVMSQKISEINNFFWNDCVDTDFLISNSINIVYTNSPVQNLYLVEVHPNVYVLNT